MQIPSHLPAIGISFVVIFAIATPLLFFSGHVPVEDLMFVVGVSVFGLIVFILGRNKPHPAIHRLRDCIQPLDADQDLIALRQKQHFDQLTDDTPASPATKGGQPTEDAQERG